MRALPRNVWVLSLTSFFRDIASEMLVHLLPLFLANVLSVRIAVIGLIEGVAETTASLMKIYSGWLSDKLGRRKGLTVAGYGLAALAMPLLLIARTWPFVLLYRFLDRMGKGTRTAPRDALIADSVVVRQRGVSFGLHRAADSAGAFLGLLVAIRARSSSQNRWAGAWSRSTCGCPTARWLNTKRRSATGRGIERTA